VLVSELLDILVLVVDVAVKGVEGELVVEEESVDREVDVDDPEVDVDDPLDSVVLELVSLEEVVDSEVLVVESVTAVKRRGAGFCEFPRDEETCLNVKLGAPFPWFVREFVWIEHVPKFVSPEDPGATNCSPAFGDGSSPRAAARPEERRGARRQSTRLPKYVPVASLMAASQS